MTFKKRKENGFSEVCQLHLVYLNGNNLKTIFLQYIWIYLFFKTEYIVMIFSYILLVGWVNRVPNQTLGMPFPVDSFLSIYLSIELNLSKSLTVSQRLASHVNPSINISM